MEIDTRLAEVLEVLRDQPERDPELMERGRAVFMEQAEQMAASLPLAVPVDKKPRLNRWMHEFQSFFAIRRKERTPMFGVIGTLLLIISMALGGSGITVAAAQQSLPEDGLYPVKTWSESLRVRLTEREHSRLQLALELANRRAEEVQAMVRADQVPPQAVQARMRAELDLALELAFNQPEQERVRVLAQIREQLQKLEHAFVQLGPQANAENAALLHQTRSMLQERLQICQDGLTDPAALQKHLRDQDRQQDGTKTGPGPIPSQPAPGEGRSTEVPPAPGSGYGPGPGDGTGDDNVGENNPWVDDGETPEPGSGYGPGPGEGNNPWTDETPTPGSGYGPGPGPQPEQTQPGSGPGGNSNGDNGAGSGGDPGSEDSGSGNGSNGDGGGAGDGGNGGGKGK